MAGDRLVVDLNFAYNPSCAYNPAWTCPLATPRQHARGRGPRRRARVPVRAHDSP